MVSHQACLPRTLFPLRLAAFLELFLITVSHSKLLKGNASETHSYILHNMFVLSFKQKMSMSLFFFDCVHVSPMIILAKVLNPHIHESNIPLFSTPKVLLMAPAEVVVEFKSLQTGIFINMHNCVPSTTTTLNLAFLLCGKVLQ